MHKAGSERKQGVCSIKYLHMLTADVNTHMYQLHHSAGVCRAESMDT